MRVVRKQNPSLIYKWEEEALWWYGYHLVEITFKNITEYLPGVKGSSVRFRISSKDFRVIVNLQFAFNFAILI